MSRTPITAILAAGWITIAGVGQAVVQAQSPVQPKPLSTRKAQAVPGAPAVCDSQWASSFGKSGMDSFISAMYFGDVGEGPSLYAGGTFAKAGGVLVNHVARRVPGGWAAMAAGVGAGNFTIQGMYAHDDGRGPGLYVGGDFSEIGGCVGNGIARWDATGWSRLDSGVNGSVRNALMTFDDGTGAQLYVGGDFSVAGGVPVANLARWNGVVWSDVGGGVSGDTATVRALAVFNDGSGTQLYVAGNFTTAGAVNAANIARWDGRLWSPVGGGLNGLVRCLMVFDDGTGPALYAGGEFTSAPPAPAAHIARWNGREWSQVGGGLNANARWLVVFDDGEGPALYAVGNFTQADGHPAAHAARWNGHAWSALGAGLSDNAYAVAMGDDGSGLSLYVGGSFQAAGGHPAENVARWFRNCPGDLNCDGRISVQDMPLLLQAILDPLQYKSLHPGCNFLNADCDRDGEVTPDDLPAFMALLGGGVSSTAAPAP
jgi:hypothetical protein